MADFYETPDWHKLALEAGDLGVWCWDIATDRIEWDGHAAECWGVSAEAPVTMRMINELVHSDDRDGKLAANRRALEPGGSGDYQAEYRIIRSADQTVRHLYSRGKAQFVDGKAIRVFGIVRDVSERREAEQTIRRSEARLAGILSIAADAIISIDDLHRVIMFNHGAETVFGYAADEVIGQPLDMLLPERFRPSHADHVRQFAVSPTTARLMGERRDVFGLRKNGQQFPAEASISKLEIGGERTFTVVLRDITARVWRERALKESEERLGLALAAGHIGLFEHDHKSDALYWSPLFCVIIGVGPNETPSLQKYLALIPSDERERVIEAVGAAHDVASDGVYSGEHRIVRPDGVTRWLSVNSQTYFACTGSARHQVRTIGAVLDVTSRKASEQALAQANRDLETRVTERTRELQEEMQRRELAQAALAKAQRMEAFGQLTGGVAHDFNNLLTVISGNQELLEMRLEDPKDRVLLKRAQEAAEMGARLTSRLLTFARRRQLEPTLLNLNDQITGMVELLRRSIGEQVTLTTKLAPRLWPVRTDASEIENAVLNLAINARDAMPNGGTIVVETADCTVDADEVGGESNFACRSGAGADAKLPPGDYVRLSVSDTGTGMPPEVLQRAFEPFFTTKPPGKGTGLGLSTIYGFVQQSGGTVTVYSEVASSANPGGTTVNIYLPRVVEFGKTTAADRTDTVPVAGNGETVLLVEDRADVRDVTRSRLQQLGYVVVEAESGRRAIEMLQAGGRVELVFSDVVMPGGISGFDLVRWLHAHRPELKVLLTSGFSEEVAAAREGELPTVKLLRKPYSSAELMRALRGALDE